MNTSLLRSLAAAALLGLAGAAQAVVMTAPVTAAGNFTVTDTTGPGTPLSVNVLFVVVRPAQPLPMLSHAPALTRVDAEML